MVSPDTSYPVRVEEVQAQEAKTETGAMESWVVSQVQARGKEDKKESISLWLDDRSMQETWWKLCDAECKIKTLKDIGIRPEIAESLVTNCKALAEDPVNCIRIGAFIVKNESGGGYRCKKSNTYNCSGMSVNENYKSYNDWIIHWVWKYNKFWYNQRNPDSFYSNSPDWNPKTRYCMSEKQPNWTKLDYCPNWHRIAWGIYNKLKSW